MKGILFFLWITLLLCVFDAGPCAAWGRERANDTLMINNLYREASQNLDRSSKHADTLINKAWKKSIEISYQRGVADGYYYSGRLLESRDNISGAIEYYEKARSIYVLVDDVRQAVDTHIRLAELYSLQDQLFLAHRSYREAVKTANAYTDTLSKIKAKVGYASFKNKVERDYHGAIRLLDSIRGQASERQLEPFVGAIHLIYSDSYYHIRDFDRALSSGEQAAAHFRGIGDHEGVLRAVLSQVTVWEEVADLQALQAKLDEADSLEVSLDTNSTLWTEYHMLKIKRDLRFEEYESALERAEVLYTHLRKRGNTNDARKVVALMANANYALGKLEDANRLFDRFQYLSDSLLVEQFVQADAELSDKFILARQEDVDRLKLSNAIYQRYGLIASVVVLLAILVILYIHFREKDKLANRVAIKNAEISVQNEILKQANIQNELLLREIHHRVKNNLQIINSLLSLQARKTTLPEVVGIMKESRSRLNSIALIHNKLYQQHSLSKLNIQEYIEQLVFHLLSIYNVNNNEIEVSIDARQVSLDVDTAIPLGLILTELITNSLKYAFVDRGSGSITISVSHGQDTDYKMVYADDGKGMPEGEFDAAKNTLGFKLVRSLIDQLNGDVSYEGKNGRSQFVIHFQSHA